MVALEIAFWGSLALIFHTHVGYPALLWVLSRLPGGRPEPGGPPASLPGVSLIVAAHDEEDVIADRVANALALDYPRERLQIVVASDGSTDRTAERARAAGADLVLELSRGGKVTALNAAVERSSGEVLAFTDANTSWAPDALRLLVARLAEDRVGYVCGQVRFESATGANEEGLYWRYEMAVRRLESGLAGITAGNGAINAVRRDAYVFLDPERGQDISFPFLMVKRGLRPVYEPRALARERLAPTIAGEFERKRRMMAGAWGTMIDGGLLSPRGYRPLYAFQMFSHRLLRYASPLLHVVALATNVALLGQGTVYAVTLAAQLALVAAGALGAVVRLRPLRIANYYLAVTASSAVGLWDYLRRGVPRTWERVEGTR